MYAKSIGLVVLALIAAELAGVVIWARQPEIAAIRPPDQHSFDQALVAKGARLAALGNCGLCHTAQGGREFAGGVAINTGFGTVFGSNITPDPDTGIGRWSELAFRRAMRDGVDREGRHLYPAFPYDYFTRLTDDDVKALYAFLMTREPVQATASHNRLAFPFDIRLAIAGWKLMFLNPGRYRPDPSHDAEWNRGAYLSQGLAHCGACHTPRNALGATERRHDLAGGEVEGWTAPALNDHSPAPVPWKELSLFAYLRHGWDRLHGGAAGPMAPIVHNLARAPADDVRAISAYIDSVEGPPSEERKTKAEALVAGLTRQSGETTGAGAVPRRSGAGASIYRAQCASCHTESGTNGIGGAINFALSSPMNAATPRNAIRIVLGGMPPVENQGGIAMPRFSAALADKQIADVLEYIRTRVDRRPAWHHVAREVRKLAEEYGRS